MSVLHMDLGINSYDIVLERGALKRAKEIFKLNRKVLIVTDEGVPAEYAKAIADVSVMPVTVRLPQGEGNKCPETWLKLLGVMLENHFDRHDCVVAVGGGVMGDLAGFAAAAYMRGIDFYNVPTTLLSQVDSSVGGKVAIDLNGYKNTVGAFWQPKAVLIDPEVLSTLDARQVSCGVAEIIKMFATFNKEAFCRMESEAQTPVEELIEAALKIKMNVVEQDEKESGLRAVLNFGHTVGHAIESVSAEDEKPLLHGECVGLGMLCVTVGVVQERIKKLLVRYQLPVSYTATREAIQSAMCHDKKADHNTIKLVAVPEIGSFEFKKLTTDEIMNQVSGGLIYQ